MSSSTRRSPLCPFLRGENRFKSSLFRGIKGDLKRLPPAAGLFKHPLNLMELECSVPQFKEPWRMLLRCATHNRAFEISSQACTQGRPATSSSARAWVGNGPTSFRSKVMGWWLRLKKRARLNTEFASFFSDFVQNQVD